MKKIIFACLCQILLLSAHAQYDLTSLFKLTSLNAISQKFGKENVVKVQSDLVFGDIVPSEYVINKSKLTEFSILFDNNKVMGVVVRNKTNNSIIDKYLQLPYGLKPGMSLEQLFEVNKAPFSMNAFLKNLNWKGGLLDNNTKCIDIHLTTSKESETAELYNKLSNGNLMQEIMYNNQFFALYHVIVDRIIYFCPLPSSNQKEPTLNKSDVTTKWKTFTHKYGFSIELPTYFSVGSLTRSGIQYYITSIDENIMLTVELSSEGALPLMKKELLKNYQYYLNNSGYLNITSKILKDTWFEIIGENDTEYVYTKETIKNNKTFVLTISYPKNEKDLIANILPRISKSFQ